MQDEAGDVILFDTGTPYPGPGADLVDLLNVWVWIDGPHLKVEMEVVNLEQADTWTTVPLSSIFYLVKFTTNSTAWEVRATHQLTTGLGGGLYPWNYYFGPYNEPDNLSDINGSVSLSERKWFAEIPLAFLGNLTGVSALTGFAAHAQTNQGDSSLVDDVSSDAIVPLPSFTSAPPGNESSPPGNGSSGSGPGGPVPEEKKRDAPTVGIWAPIVALAAVSTLRRLRIKT